MIITALSSLIISGLFVFFLHEQGKTVFWIGGLALCRRRSGAVGLAPFLARIIPPGREGEVFGLYATTGRVMCFLAPRCGRSSSAFGATHFGILGIVIVLAIGLGLLIPVKAVQERLRD